MADNNTILEKLEGLVARFEEVSTLITDPAVIADQKRYVKLTKEYKELGDLMNARKEYMQVLRGIEEAKEIIANETDQEMREMAREELDACQTRQPELEEQIKLLLVPAGERNEAVVCLSLFIDEGEDALRACARHDDGIDLLGELVDIARELLGHVEERDENGDIQRQRRCSRRFQGNCLLRDGRQCIRHTEI